MKSLCTAAILFTLVALPKFIFAECGNGVPEAGETCMTCAADVLCVPLTLCSPDTASCRASCGNGTCESAAGENCSNCADCACDPQSSCDWDTGRCQTRCGNHQCEPDAGETPASCRGDCLCGNGQCEPEAGETCDTCSDCACDAAHGCNAGQCLSRCGNNSCEADAGENYVTCWDDCKDPLVGCTPGESISTALVRASRRGQKADSFSLEEAPGQKWGSAYDTGENGANFGIWSDVATLQMHNSASAPLTQGNGTPGDLMKLGMAEIGDPSSTITLLESKHPLNDYRHTATASVLNIMGTDSLPQENNEFRQWPAYVAVDMYLSSAPAVAPAPMAGDSWGLGWPGLSLDPPQSCNATPCDTQQETIPYPPQTPQDLHYGPNPDSHTPYIVLDHRAPWGIISGQVLDHDMKGINTVSVIVVDRLNRFPPIEKITRSKRGSDGIFEILVPARGSFNVLINPRIPPAEIPLSTHYYHPNYGPHLFPNVMIPEEGDNPFSLGGTVLPTVQQSALMSAGSGAIGGLLLSEETTGRPLKNMAVYLRDAEGKILKAQKTDAEGRFLFKYLAAGKYFLNPVLRRTWLAAPARLDLDLSIGEQSLNNFFTLRGVPAHLEIKTPAAGTFVLLTAKEWTETIPPSLESTTATLIVSATADESRVARPELKAGSRYYLTCWVPKESGAFERRPALGSVLVKDGNLLAANETSETSCP